jgi:hypothetical protein
VPRGLKEIPQERRTVKDGIMSSGDALITVYVKPIIVSALLIVIIIGCTKVFPQTQVTCFDLIDSSRFNGSAVSSYVSVNDLFRYQQQLMFT